MLAIITIAACTTEEAPYLTLADGQNNSITLPASGGSETISFTTNYSWTAESSEDWLTISPASGEAGEHSIKVSATVNTENASRTAKVKILSSVITATLSVTQDKTGDNADNGDNGDDSGNSDNGDNGGNNDEGDNGGNNDDGDNAIEVYMETKGGLEATLSSYDKNSIISLKITGVLNDEDFIFIRSIQSLRNLDISGVNISEIPGKIFYKATIEQISLPKTLTSIGEESFYSSKLKSIEIPANVEIIGQSAFRCCSSLESVTFEPDSKLKIIESGGFTDISDIYSYYCYYYGAFSHCESLKSIEIPASVETIEGVAFYGCI